MHDACVNAWQQGGASEARLEVFAQHVRAQDFYAARGWTADPDRPGAGSHLMLRLVLPAATARSGRAGASVRMSAGPPALRARVGSWGP